MIVILFQSHLFYLNDLIERLRGDLDYTILLNQDRLSVELPQFPANINVIKVENYNTTLQLEEVIALSKAHCLTDIVAVFETDILRAHRLKQALGMTDFSESYISLFRDKLKMKEFFKKHDVPMAEYCHAKSLPDIINFINVHGYPIVPCGYPIA